MVVYRRCDAFAAGTDVKERAADVANAFWVAQVCGCGLAELLAVPRNDTSHGSFLLAGVLSKLGSLAVASEADEDELSFPLIARHLAAPAALAAPPNLGSFQAHRRTSRPADQAVLPQSLQHVVGAAAAVPLAFEAWDHKAVATVVYRCCNAFARGTDVFENAADVADAFGEAQVCGCCATTTCRTLRGSSACCPSSGRFSAVLGALRAFISAQGDEPDVWPVSSDADLDFTLSVSLVKADWGASSSLVSVTIEELKEDVDNADKSARWGALRGPAPTMDADGAPRNAEARLTVEAAPVLALLQSDVATRILRLAARLDALLVTKRVARTARVVAPVLRKLICKDRIMKGTAILKGHRGSVNFCAFSPDGKRIVTASGDKAWIWDAETSAPLATLEGHTDAVECCAFSPDGKRLVTASMDETARHWDAATGALLVTLKCFTDAVFCCAFSPDGTRVVTGTLDKTAMLWDAETGALLATLEGHTDWVTSCAFSPDGKRI
ncbi:hypothetical protein M885DRAFT_615346, partial [Pelagophyceae sp. CCMP2097]